MSAVNNISKVLQYIKSSKGFDGILKMLVIKSLENGRCIAEMTVKEEHANPGGGLHGGLSSTLVDSVSSFALLSHKNGDTFSVSVDLHLVFTKGVKVGETIEIDADTLKVGKTLAFLDVTIKNKDTGDLLIKGSHTKYMMR